MSDPATPTAPLSEGDLEASKRLQEAFKDIKRQLARVIVGQDQVIEELLIALFSRGHCMLEGVPGLAKTLMISTLAKCLSLAFSRIQFTPDLMPSDITGTEVIEENRGTGHREFKFIEGPLFANLILADEINRTPPKTQAALLEAMQERQVTVGRIRHKLSDPFFVLATQNPIEQEGTYPLPEAQQDRFMFKIFVKCPKFIKEWLAWGAGPRATQYLILGGKARALLKGRTHVQTEDIQELALPVLRHRILTNFTAASEGITTDKVIDRIIRDTPTKEA